MTTLSEVTGQIRSRLEGTIRPFVVQLGATCNQDDTTLHLSADGVTPALTANSLIEVGLETMYVVSSNRDNATVKVIRGWNNSENEAHLAGDIIRTNPRFFTAEIRTAFWTEVASSFPVLGKPWSFRLNASPGGRDYVIPFGDSDGALEAYSTDKLGIAAIPGREVGETLQIMVSNRFGAGLRIGGTVRQSVALDDDIYATGMQTPVARLTFDSPVMVGGDVLVTVLIPYDAGIEPDSVSEYEDMNELLGCSRSGLNALMIGAMWRLTEQIMVSRTDIEHQSESRKAEEVGMQDIGAVRSNLLALRKQARAEEQQRIRATYGIRRG